MILLLFLLSSITLSLSQFFLFSPYRVCVYRDSIPTQLPMRKIKRQSKAKISDYEKKKTRHSSSFLSSSRPPSLSLLFHLSPPLFHVLSLSFLLSLSLSDPNHKTPKICLSKRTKKRRRPLTSSRARPRARRATSLLRRPRRRRRPRPSAAPRAPPRARPCPPRSRRRWPRPRRRLRRGAA